MLVHTIRPCHARSFHHQGGEESEFIQSEAAQEMDANLEYKRLEDEEEDGDDDDQASCTSLSAFVHSFGTFSPLLHQSLAFTFYANSNAVQN